MPFPVEDRVHVIPVGYEKERVIQSAVSGKADKVILIGHENNDQVGSRYWKKVIEELANYDIEIVKDYCDIFDLYSSLGIIAQKLHEHKSDNCYVNVATGSKVTAIAGMIASMVTDSTAYYVRAESYHGEGEAPKGVKSVIELPNYPIDSPEEEQVATLEYIRRRNAEGETPSKGQLIHFSQSNGFGFMDENVKGKGKYRLLDTHILDPLKNEEYVEEVKEGRTKRVEITEKGRNAIQAFIFLIDQSAVDWRPEEEN